LSFTDHFCVDDVNDKEESLETINSRLFYTELSKFDALTKKAIIDCLYQFSSKKEMVPPLAQIISKFYSIRTNSTSSTQRKTRPKITTPKVLLSTIPQTETDKLKEENERLKSENEQLKNKIKRLEAKNFVCQSGNHEGVVATRLFDEDR